MDTQENTKVQTQGGQQLGEPNDFVPDVTTSETARGTGHAETPDVNEKPYVVGVGASAGGLEALERFFRAVPADCGMAFVVIQHLSPDFRSLMDELLGRVTPMAIVRVLEPVDVRPNTVYILPPRKEMVLQGGQLVTYDKPTGPQLSLPINTFFRSLAREQGDRSIAIVLSGTGTDGSIGIQDVHDVGGLVLAQSEETAKFDGMPKSAIATGCVDAVLAPEDMPAPLLEYVRDPSHTLSALRPTRASSDELTGVAAVFEKLREIYNLDFTYYKSATITRRMDRRASLGASGIFKDYLDLVLRDRAELDKLYKDLLIGVTRFFRDPEAFETIEREVIPGLLDAVPPQEEIRIWVPGCATGEEPYSLAILFLEAFDTRNREPNIKIFASDMHRDSLQRAAEGVYTEESISVISPARRENFFIKESDGRYKVTARLRKQLIFSPHNLIKDPPFTKVDLVSCRNLLIYLEPNTQNRVLASFHFALKPRGALFLGPSEGAGELAAEFDTIDRQWKIFRKTRDTRLPIDMRLNLVPPPANGATPLLAPTGLRLPRIYEALLNHYMPTGVLVNERREVLHVFGAASRFLQPAVGRMSSDVVSLTQGDLRIALSSAIQNAAKKGQRAMLKGVRHEDSLGKAVLNVVADPIVDKVTGAGFTMLLFEETTPPAEPQPSAPASFEVGAEARQRIISLEQELQHTREALQSTIEELETSGEELQASNEELLASNEELQSTNEELHSVNEELYSVNSEHERKIKELNELTADWGNLMRSTDIGTIFLDEQYRIRLFTPKAAELFNLLPQDVGRDIRHITSRVVGDDVFAVLPSVMAGRPSAEVKLSLTDGRTFLRRVLPYVTHDKSTEGIVITLVDITELARAEFAVRENESRFRGMIQALGEGIVLLERGGTVLSCNGEAARMFGFDTAELIGQTLPAMADIQLLRENGTLLSYEDTPMRRALQTGVSQRGMTLGIQRAGHNAVWAIANAEPICVPGDREPAAVLTSLTDITARKAAEDSLLMLSQAVEQSSHGVQVTDAEGNMEYVNDAFIAASGFPREALIGRNPSILASGLTPRTTYEQLWKCLTAGDPWRGEFINRRRNGELVIEFAHISPVRDAAGRIAHYLAIKEDITEKKRNSEELDRHRHHLQELVEQRTRELAEAK
ncbi:MAG: chemotaxis protein CheB, partial [Rhodocyclaceae bacterium]